MIIKSIKLKEFRNYSNYELFFKEGINLLYGVNGAGKTSILEAIYFLSTCRSFKSNEENVLINKNSDYFEIVGEINKNKNFISNIDIVYKKSSKNIRINGKVIKKVSLLRDQIKCLYFIPSDSKLLSGYPSIRRKYLNINIGNLSKKYLSLYSEYNKLKKSRNILLKKEKYDRNLIDAITEQIISIEEEIYNYRWEYVKNVNLYLSKIYKRISQDKNNIEIVYQPNVDGSKNYKKNALNKYQNAMLKHQDLNFGIEKDNFIIVLNGLDLKKYGSQGQNRMAIISLKIAPFYLNKNKEDSPIILLDDVFGELDPQNQTNLMELLKTFPQVFITSTFKINENNSNKPNINLIQITKE